MLGHSIENPKARNLPPIDVRPENFHNSKKEFQAERNAVEASIGHANGLIQQIWLWVFDEAIEDSVAERLSDWLDDSAFRRNDLRDFRIDKTEFLLLHAAKSSSFAMTAMCFVVELLNQLRERRSQLDDQEAQYWNVPHRPANYFARTIALRTARIYASEFRQAPTLGTARDGGHPNTAFGKALEQIFQILNIESGVRAPAKWAIDQLTADDFSPDKRDPLTKALMDHYLTNKPRPSKKPNKEEDGS